MRKKKISFDYSSLNRDLIALNLYELKSQIVKIPLTAFQIHQLLTKHLKKYYPLRFKKSYTDKKEQNIVYVGGIYHSWFDQDRKKCIELIFEYPKQRKITLTTQKFSSLCYNVADTILHEVIHMRQFRRRDFKILPEYASNAEKTEVRQEQAYLGCSDEIDAYSFNIACELIDRYGYNQKRILKYLNENQKSKRRRPNTWRMYLKAFEHDHNHIIIKRVKKKIIRYLPQAENGRPYKNKDWINW
jgi:hypothetical protein